MVGTVDILLSVSICVRVIGLEMMLGNRVVSDSPVDTTELSGSPVVTTVLKSLTELPTRTVDKVSETKLLVMPDVSGREVDTALETWVGNKLLLMARLVDGVTSLDRMVVGPDGSRLGDNVEGCIELDTMDKVSIDEVATSVTNILLRSVDSGGVALIVEL